MLLGQAFNNISYARRFNALKQFTVLEIPGKRSNSLKKKRRYLLKKHNFYLMKNVSRLSLELPKVKKTSKDVFSAVTNKQQPFRRGPYWDTNIIRVVDRMSRWCSPIVTGNIHRNQANNNTKINIGQFQGYQVKSCHSKVMPPNKISLSYRQFFNVRRVHPLVRALSPINPVPKVPLSGILKLFYSNWAKLTQDLNILNIVQEFEIPFLENPVQRKSPNYSVLNQEQSKLVKEELKKIFLKGAIKPLS